MIFGVTSGVNIREWMCGLNSVTGIIINNHSSMFTRHKNNTQQSEEPVTMGTPRTHPDHLSSIILFLWLTALYLLGATAVGGSIVFIFLQFSIVTEISNYSSTVVMTLLPMDLGDILTNVIAILVTVIFFMLVIILPLQLPGWLIIQASVGKLRSLPKDIKFSSLFVLRWIARLAAIAYIWAVVGSVFASCGFSIELATLNRNFTLGIGDINDIFLSISKVVLLLVILVFAQLPGWFGLWYLRQPSSSLPITDDRLWQQRTAKYLRTSTTIAIIAMAGYWGYELIKIAVSPEHELTILNVLSVLVTGGIGMMAILLFAQIPCWLVMGWLEQQQRQATIVPKTAIDPLQLLSEVTIGYLATIFGAGVVWWFELEKFGHYDIHNIFISRLPPVLDALLWAQIPGWIALFLWFALWLNQARKQLVA